MEVRRPIVNGLRKEELAMKRVSLLWTLLLNPPLQYVEVAHMLMEQALVLLALPIFKLIGHGFLIHWVGIIIFLTRSRVAQCSWVLRHILIVIAFVTRTERRGKALLKNAIALHLPLRELALALVLLLMGMRRMELMIPLVLLVGRFRNSFIGKSTMYVDALNTMSLVTALGYGHVTLHVLISYTKENRVRNLLAVHWFTTRLAFTTKKISPLLLHRIKSLRRGVRSL